MKSIVPYTKEIKFASKLAEICSISLEHELNITDTEIEGNFILSGEYKTHEISINKEKFLYKLPFSVEVTDTLIKDSIDFEITDFTYEIVNSDTLKVNIEFSVSAEEEEILLPEDNAESLSREAIVEEVNDLFLEPEDTPEIVLEEVHEEEKKEESADSEERLDQKSAELILDSANHKEDEYTTYFVHLVKSGDTIESIVATYQTDLSILKKYNTLDTMNVGDKIIIPSLDE